MMMQSGDAVPHPQVFEPAPQPLTPRPKSAPHPQVEEPSQARPSPPYPQVEEHSRSCPSDPLLLVDGRQQQVLQEAVSVPHDAALVLVDVIVIVDGAEAAQRSSGPCAAWEGGQGRLREGEGGGALRSLGERGVARGLAQPGREGSGKGSCTAWERGEAREREREEPFPGHVSSLPDRGQARHALWGEAGGAVGLDAGGAGAPGRQQPTPVGSGGAPLAQQTAPGVQDAARGVADGTQPEA